MAVSSEKSAPYATAGTIIDILNRYRNRGMSTPFNSDVLSRSGVSDSLIPRTMQSLQILELIDEDGMPTDILEGLRLAPTDEYPLRLVQWLQGAYADVFSFVDPETDNEIAIRDAFRTYTPTGQQDRMVNLFIGLCEEAGIREKTTKETKPRTRKPSITQLKVKQKKVSRPQATIQSFTGKVPPAIAGLIESLPPEDKGWTQEQHDKFLTTFGAVLDYCYPIVEADKNDDTEDDLSFLS